MLGNLVLRSTVGSDVQNISGCQFGHAMTLAREASMTARIFAIFCVCRPSQVVRRNAATIALPAAVSGFGALKGRRAVRDHAHGPSRRHCLALKQHTSAPVAAI